MEKEQWLIECQFECHILCLSKKIEEKLPCRSFENDKRNSNPLNSVNNYFIFNPVTKAVINKRFGKLSWGMEISFINDSIAYVYIFGLGSGRYYCSLISTLFIIDLSIFIPGICFV